MGSDEAKAKGDLGDRAVSARAPAARGFGQIELEQKICIEPTKPRPDFFLSFHEVEG